MLKTRQKSKNYDRPVLFKSPQGIYFDPNLGIWFKIMKTALLFVRHGS